LTPQFVEMRGKQRELCILVDMSPKADGVRERLERCLADTAAVSGRLQAVVGDPQADVAELSRLEAELARLGAERTRLMAALRAAEGAAAMTSSRHAYGGRPLREIALDVVDALGVPSAPRVVSDFGQARYGVQLPSARIASLRRDEKEAFKADPRSRPAFLAPALLAESLTAMPRLVTSSAWPLERRIIGSRSLRVNHLRTLMVVCDAMETMVGRDEPAQARLIWMGSGLAGTVPGGLDRGAGFDPHRAREAARAELGLLEEDDAGERAAAAERAKGRDLMFQVWGGPAVIPGEGGRKRADL
jgi:hypothetical protein